MINSMKVIAIIGSHRKGGIIKKTEENRVRSQHYTKNRKHWGNGEPWVSIGLLVRRKHGV